MSEGPQKVSACVIVFNEEQKVARCLASLTWCDEIIVVDSFSTDRTVEVASRYTDKVLRHEWLGYVGQRNMIRDQASHPWILYLDADEEVSPSLRHELQRVLGDWDGVHVGYEFPRLVFFLGRWIRHGEWYPDVKLRLFHRDYGRTEGIEPHDKVAVRGPVKRLASPVWHYTYNDLTDMTETANRFSSITAQQKFVADKRFRLVDLYLRPPFRFIKGYLLKRGFLDGLPGFLVAVNNAYSAFLKYAKLWELHLRQRDDYRQFPDG